MNGHGGWPLTILMTPDQKPFFAGTYLPKESKGQMYGFIPLLQNVIKVWETDKSRLIESAEILYNILKQEENETAGNITNEPSNFPTDQAIFDLALQQFEDSYDTRYGGFGQAPKFPTPHNLLFLLRVAKQRKDDYAIRMVENTLDGMYAGGIYDHIGGGFARYSTDEKWLVPHFEKMLYDNAMLVLAYTEAYQFIKKPLYKTIVHETLQYILREMTDDNGGFYCAQDADSEGEEGKYYTFTPEEIISVLGEEDGRRFNSFYDITTRGNFEGTNIPNRIGKDLTKDLEQAQSNGQAKVKNQNQEHTHIIQTLYNYRLSRTHLYKDDKILTSWNALMITAFAKAYQVFRNPEYILAAERAYQWIQEKHRNEQGRLMVRYREGHLSGLGNLDDYAYLTLAQVTLYEVTLNPIYLLQAKRDVKEMTQLFFDEENGGFYFYGSDATQLILRPKEVYDGAMPSGNSVAAYVLAKLEKLTREDNITETCEKQINWLSNNIKEYPMAYSFGLCALMISLTPHTEIVCIIKNEVEKEELLQLLRKSYLPDASVVLIEENTYETLQMAAPFTADYKLVVEEAEIYICEDFACRPPLKGMGAFKEYVHVS